MTLSASGAIPKLLTDSATAPAGPTQVIFETMSVTGTFQTTEAASNEFSQALLARAETITPLLEQILHVRPPPHWGINE